MPRKATEAAATTKPAAKRTTTRRTKKVEETIVLSWEHVAERALGFALMFYRLGQRSALPGLRRDRATLLAGLGEQRLGRLQILAGQAGLQIAEVIHEAEELSISGSESYVKDIPLTDPRYPLSSYSKRLLAWNRRKTDKARAQEMNRRQEADMVCFYLKKVS